MQRFVERFKSFFTKIPLVIAVLVVSSFSAPYNGDTITLKQPDNTEVKVLMFGDEFFGWFETPDGYVLVADSKGWLCYAEIGEDGTYKATDVRYTQMRMRSKSNTPAPSDLDIKPKLRLSADKIRELRKKTMDEMNGMRNTKSRRKSSQSSQSSLSYPQYLNDEQSVRVGSYRGLNILIDFSDEPATVPVAEIDSFLNQKEGYTKGGNNGSVREFFNDVSGGKLDYTNYVTAYYRAKNPKSYYNNTAYSSGPSARELITEALEYLRDVEEFDFSTLSTDSNGVIYAINCLYAGNRPNVWATGLWPHSWSLWPVFEANGVKAGRYQICDIGNSLTIGTYAHENGHMLLDYPDFYDYTYQSTGLGHFCLMAYGGSNYNPVPPNPYLRNYSGWENIVDITYIKNDTLLHQKANDFTTFRYLNAINVPATEYFLLQSINNTERYSSIPASGLAIWHYEKYGYEDYYDMTCNYHYRVSLVQADGEYHLERNVNYGANNDFFKAGGNDEFSDATIPNANWWCPTLDGDNNSYLRVYDISGVDSVMSFRVHGASDFTVKHPSVISKDDVPQVISVITGIANQVVNISSRYVNVSGVTNSSGNVSISADVSNAPDTLWVTVTGCGYRYCGSIIVRDVTTGDDTVSQVMGFENAFLWGFIANNGGTLGNNSENITQGNKSLDIKGNGYQQIKSVDLQTSKINATSSTLKLDVFVGSTQPNPYYIGQVQMFINCPTAGIYNQFVGHSDFTNSQLDEFKTVTFLLPSSVMNVLSGDYSDFSFSIVLNTNSGSGPYYLDNLRF